MVQLERVVASAATPLRFMIADATASLTNVPMPVVEVRDPGAGSSVRNMTTEVVLPWDYQVVAITVSASTPRTAGTLTVEATINGAATGLTAALDAVNTQWARTRQPRDADRGAAGSRVGAAITTTGAWTPTTADVACDVWVIPRVDGV